MKRKILLVGAGLTNAVIYHQLMVLSNRSLDIEVIEKRDHIGGNCYDERVDDYFVHKYGPHIFHTNNKAIWNMVNTYAEFKPYFVQVMATDLKQVYNLPYNMNTFTKIWTELRTPTEVRAKIQEEVAEYFKDSSPKETFMDFAVSKVGTTVFNKLIRDYTMKQWGVKDINEVPISIINRIPVRFSYDNNSFNDTYQGIPIDGYTRMIENMFNGANIKLNTDFITDGYVECINEYDAIFYSGPIDELYNKLNNTNEILDYRSLKFVELTDENTQGCAIMTYDTMKVPYTRVTEHRYFYKREVEGPTVKTYEFPAVYDGKNEPYYPIQNEKNIRKYNLMKDRLPQTIIPVGRLGKYEYLNMDRACEAAIEVANNFWKVKKDE